MHVVSDGVSLKEPSVALCERAKEVARHAGRARGRGHGAAPEKARLSSDGQPAFDPPTSERRSLVQNISTISTRVFVFKQICKVGFFHHN